LTREDVVVGLDIGTTKVCTVIGHGDAQGRITIAGVGLAPSRGLKKGIVIDVDDTVAAIRDSVESARHMAGIDVSAVVAGVTGEHIQSSNRRGAVTISGEESVVTEEDVERVMHAAAMEVPRDREIIHSLPRDFAVDGHSGVRRPVGMCGQRLEVETHIVTGAAGFLQNVVQCVERAGLVVDALVLESIATSEAVATADERELGIALIDIGGGTSDIAVFMDGSISFSTAIPVGGNHVTRDISIGLRTPFEIAERLKVERGCRLARTDTSRRSAGSCFRRKWRALAFTTRHFG
jgi:cell division protein FtsA